MSSSARWPRHEKTAHPEARETGRVQMPAGAQSRKHDARSSYSVQERYLFPIGRVRPKRAPKFSRIPRALIISPPLNRLRVMSARRRSQIRAQSSAFATTRSCIPLSRHAPTRDAAARRRFAEAARPQLRHRCHIRTAACSCTSARLASLRSCLNMGRPTSCCPHHPSSARSCTPASSMQTVAKYGKDLGAPSDDVD